MSSHKDRYRLEPRHLGIGGQAKVFQAVHRGTGEVVALKRVDSKDEDALARMRREIEVARALTDCVHVIDVLDYDSDDFRWYTMPLASEVLSAAAVPLADADIMGVVTASFGALKAAHEHGFLHRDIKPDNILRVDGNWVIADWGLVRRPLGETTKQRTTGFVGTLAYAAPEAFDDAHGMTASSDFFSVGRVVAWLATGTTPEVNVPLAASTPWDLLVERLCERAPEARPQTAEDGLRLLARVRAAVDSSSFAGRIAARVGRRERAAAVESARRAEAARVAKLIADFGESLLEDLIEEIASKAEEANGLLPNDRQITVVERQARTIVLRYGGINYCVRHHLMPMLEPHQYFAQVVITEQLSWRRNDVRNLGTPTWPLRVAKGNRLVWDVSGALLNNVRAAEHVIERLMDMADR